MKASTEDFAKTVVASMDVGNSITYGRMFSGFCIYCDLKVVGIVCEDELFIKPTEEGRAFLGDKVCESAVGPKKGRPWFLIKEAEMSNKAWISEFIKITADALPLPKPKKKKKKVAKKA